MDTIFISNTALAKMDVGKTCKSGGPFNPDLGIDFNVDEMTCLL